MNNSGSVILIEEDTDDIKLMTDILAELRPEMTLLSFPSIAAAFGHIDQASTKPFLVICDNNYRNQNQHLLQEQLDAFPGIKSKSIPFVFYSSLGDDNAIDEAFRELNIQGYFQKSVDYEQIKADIEIILEYWERSRKPVG